MEPCCFQHCAQTMTLASKIADHGDYKLDNRVVTTVYLSRNRTILTLMVTVGATTLVP